MVVPFSEPDCRTEQLSACHSQCKQQCQGLWERIGPGLEAAVRSGPVLGDIHQQISFTTSNVTL